MDNILDQLLRDEGFRASPYKDTRGFNTVGIGHNLDANPLPGETYPLSVQRAKDILVQDVARIWGRLRADLPWASSLPDPIQGVMKNMAFNIGAKGEEAFHHMLADIQAGNYAQAAIDGTNSAWYGQVGDRAKRLMEQLRTGVWQ